MTIPTMMKGATAPTPGPPHVLAVGEHPVPAPGANDVLIKVAVAGVNRPDCLQRKGVYPPPEGASPILGLEVAGTVVAAGADVSRFKEGDQVTALIQGGGYAQYAVAHETNALPVPAGLSMEAAAALPETFFTVWSNLFDRAGLRAGEAVLVHGGSSGIGTTAIQLAKAIGAEVIVTAGSADKCAACTKLGADRAIDYQREDFVAALKEAKPDGVEVILDMVGGDYVERNWRVAAMDGRIVQIATLNGRSDVDFSLLMRKRLTHTGSTLRPRSVAFKAKIAEALQETVWPLIEAGKVRPVMDKTFPLDEVVAAHERMESSQHIGKIMLQL